MDITSAPSPLQVWVQELYDMHGMLTPQLVLDAARPPDSPAHSWIFNVDGDEAAGQYYLERSHRLIRSVKVTILSNPSAPPRRVRFFVAVPGGEESAYTYEPLDRLVLQPDKLQLARNEAVRRLNEAERSVEDLDAIADGTLFSANAEVALKAVRRAKKVLAKAG